MWERARAATRELVEGARGGDREAYDQLFERVGERLLLYVRIRLGKKLLASLEPMDVVQETYAAAHRSFAHFAPLTDDEEGAFVRWLYGIADNRIRDLARRHGAEKRNPVGGLVRGSTALARLRSVRRGPQTSCSHREDHERLLAAIHSLGEAEQDALALRYFRGLTTRGIAKELGRSETAVRRLLGVATSKLGGALGSEC